MADDYIKREASMSAERTHGYVIRWRTAGDWAYYGDSARLAEAEIHPLKVATTLAIRIASQRPCEVEIVRVRRVEGACTWEKVPNVELTNWLTTTDDRRGPRHPTFLSRRVPAAPRWEVVEEDGNG